MLPFHPVTRHHSHFGGLVWLAEGFPIKRLYDSGYTFPGQASIDYTGELGHYTKLRTQFKQRGAYQEAHTGDKLRWDDQLDIEVISPPKEFFSEPHPERRPKADPPAHYLVNANSLGLRIRHGKVVFLLPGAFRRKTRSRACCPRCRRANSSATSSSPPATACTPSPSSPRRRGGRWRRSGRMPRQSHDRAFLKPRIRANKTTDASRQTHPNHGKRLPDLTH